MVFLQLVNSHGYRDVLLFFLRAFFLAIGSIHLSIFILFAIRLLLGGGLAIYLILVVNF